ncbi:MAG: glycoside hydrolase family 95 protein [Oscillospiraceae bacterium]
MTTIKYKAPAQNSARGWERQSLPIGNGYMGMCIFGRYDTERLQFNEKTLWCGGPSKKRPDYYGGNLKGKDKSLKKMQEALLEGDSTLAKDLTSELVGIEEGYGNYLNFGDILLELNHTNVTDYERGLSISDAVSYVKYKSNGVCFTREHFASFPSNVIASRLTSDKDKALSFKMTLNVDRDGGDFTFEENAIAVKGTIEDNGLLYYAKVAINTDGTLSAENNTVQVDNASFAEIFLSAGTDYKNEYPSYRGDAPYEKVDNNISNAEKLGYEKIKSEHIKDYQSLFNRVTLKLCENKSDAYTDDLLSKFRNKSASDTEKKSLITTLFDYGRYLIIGSSRDGSLPANLQGVWNNNNSPAWGSDYHLNVNLQMCYWHTYVSNLAECAVPMLDYMNSLREPGRITAKEYHGIVSDNENPENGWVCHTQNTPFGWTCPGWSFYWGWSPAASSWMMQNCFEYYSYTMDKEMLKTKIYPMMKENALFWLSNLVYNEKQQRWVSSPSYSPEHGPISIGNTYEQELVWQLFTDTIKAGEILGDDESFISRLKDVREKLNSAHVGKWGQLKEWYEEDDWYKHTFLKSFAYKKHGCQANHRHASHLLGLFPGEHINRDTKELFDAAKVSLLDRGVTGVGMNISGWGKANRMNLWARLKDGNKAYLMLEALVSKNIATNLWDLHPPYQMDGNCGMTAGVCEMLIYSGKDYIELLPALPDNWQKGEVKGLCAKGGYVIDLCWSDGKVQDFTVYSDINDTATIYLNGKKSTVSCKKLTM